MPLPKKNNLNLNLFKITSNITDGEQIFSGEISFEEMESVSYSPIDSLNEISDRETITISAEEINDAVFYLEDMGYRDIGEFRDDQEAMEWDYSRITGDFINDLQAEQENFIEGFNDDLQQFIADNPNDWQDNFESFSRDYDLAWNDMINNAINYWQADVFSLIDEYGAITYYDSDSYEIEGYNANLHSGLDGYWDFDPWLEGDVLKGYGYYQEQEAFEVNSNGYGDYWWDFDSNGDDVIDENEYYEDYEKVWDYWYDSWYEDSPGAMFDEIHDVYWEDYWLYVDEEYDILDYWDVDVDLSFETIVPDYSDLYFNSLISSNSWQLDIGTSWQPSDISFNVNFDGSFNFDIGSITQEFSDFFFKFQYQPILNQSDSDLYGIEKFQNANYQFLESNQSNSTIYGTSGNEIINAMATSVLIDAGDGMDIINGWYGNDLIYAGYGDDILIGGLGNDILEGSYGNDIYIFETNSFGHDDLIDSDGAIIVDGSRLAGIATQDGASDYFLLGDAVLNEEEGGLKISYENSDSIFIENFENEKFGIILNHNPQSQLESIELDEDDYVVFDVIDNSSDADGDNLTLYSITQSANGDAEILNDGKIKYAPNPNFNGTDSLQYLLGDGRGGFTTKTLTIQINGENDAPLAESDSFALNRNSSITFNLSDILANDSDIEDGESIKQITIDQIIFDNPTNGIITKDYSNNTITYRPNLSFSGTDKIKYQIQDSEGDLSLSEIDFTIADYTDKEAEEIAKMDSFAIGTDSSDNLVGDKNNNFLKGKKDNDILNGNAGSDVLKGDRGNDVIYGGEGGDKLRGGAGNDILIGGYGADRLNGGKGKDLFVFKNIFDSFKENGDKNINLDLILDFVQNEDKIDLSALDFDSISKWNSAATSDHHLEYHFKNGNTIIEDQHSNFAIKLAGEIQLDNNDFIF